MRNVRIVELAAGIRATFVSFFSIVMFVALGAAVFLGLQWGKQALSTTFDETLAQSNFHDIEVQYPYGITDQSIEDLRAIEGVELVEPGYAAFVEGMVGTTTASFKVQSLTPTLDQPEVIEGTLPASAGEVALLDTWATNHGVKVGDVLSLPADATDAGSPVPYLADTEFTISALVRAPGYLAKDSSTYGASTTGSGTIDCVAFATEDAFDALAFTRALVGEGEGMV